MPKLEYFLVCESISIDRETNRISLFNVIESIKVISQLSNISSDDDESKIEVPRAPLIQLIASSSWNCEQEEFGEDHQATLRAHIPGKDAIDFNLNFTVEQQRHRLNFKLQGIPPIQEAGDLVFELLLDGEHKATHTIDVKLS